MMLYKKLNNRCKYYSLLLDAKTGHTSMHRSPSSFSCGPQQTMLIRAALVATHSFTPSTRYSVNPPGQYVASGSAKIKHSPSRSTPLGQTINGSIACVMMHRLPVASITYGSGHGLDGRLAFLPFECCLAKTGGQTSQSATRAAKIACCAKLMVSLL